jgi:hypothetical protein
MSSQRGHGGIFISYRREETAAQAGRLYDRLVDRFGEGRVFMDVDSIAIGVDFTKAIRDAVSECDILLALIGQDWPVIVDSKGTRRLDNPDDFVRIEIETALQRDIRVVPVLVDGAALPQVADLPPSLRPLTRRQTLGLSHAGFRAEVARLVVAVDEVLEIKSERTAEASKRPLRGYATEQKRWKLERVAKSAVTETLRLSSEGEAYDIAIKDRFFDVITVDEKVAVRRVTLVEDEEYPLGALSSILGCDVTITVKKRNHFKSSSITIKIGNQIVSC